MIALLVVPIVLGGYALMGVAALAGATVLAWDGAHLFLSRNTSPYVVHQRHYASSMMRALTSMVSVLVVALLVMVAVGIAVSMVAASLL